MKSTFNVSIKPELLSFAIKRSGYSIEGLVKRINERFRVKYFDTNYLNGVLEGKISPKYSDLKKIDDFIKRGIPFYFLEEPPDEKIFINFRKKHREYSIDPKIEITLREYEYLREEIKQLLEDENISYVRDFPIYSVKDDPSKIGVEIRKRLKINDIDIKAIESKELFEYIRREIERHTIFVFKDHLGYTLRGCIFLNDNLPTLILVNSTDDKNAEIFSLLHEFAHYLLNNEGIDSDDIDLEEDKDVEFWCNSFAYHFLMREEDEIKEGFSKENKEVLFNSDRLKELSNKYKLSKLAFVFRFLKLGVIDSGEYHAFLNRFPYKQKTEDIAGGNYYYTNRDRLSRKFISIVYENYQDGNISLHETYEYLGVRDNSRISQLLEVLKSE